MSSIYDPVFGRSHAIGSDIAPSEITDGVSGEFSYRAALLKEGGITPVTFMQFAGRFALLCNDTYGEYGGSTYELVVNRAHPHITVDSKELHDKLAAQPGEVFPTPVDPVLFSEVFEHAQTADLIIKPTVQIPEMPSTFAMVSWERSAGALLKFYAQGGSSFEGTDFQEDLYERMFNVDGSAPAEGMDVALGILATTELRRIAIGSNQFFNERLARFNAIQSSLGHPEMSEKTAKRPSSGRPDSRATFTERTIRRIFGK